MQAALDNEALWLTPDNEACRTHQNSRAQVELRLWTPDGAVHKLEQRNRGGMRDNRDSDFRPNPVAEPNKEIRGIEEIHDYLNKPLRMIRVIYAKDV